MTDQELLKCYTDFVPFLAAVCGPGCEIVIHDVTNPEQSIIAIGNGISGRELGDPMTDLARELQEKGTYLSGGAGGGYAGELYCSLLRAGKSGSPGHFEESTADPEPGSGLDCRGKALSGEAGNLSGPPEERAGQSSILPVCDSGEAFLQHRGLHWLWPLCRALPPE